jgi:chemotaxis methyl-accepting protein methylase
MAWSYPQLLPALSDPQFARWQHLVEVRTGIDLSQHRSILQAGLNRRLRELHDGWSGAGAPPDGYDDYLDRVAAPQGAAEWQRLVERIAVKETRFFRQPAAFELVGDHLRRRLRTAPRTLDLWSVGCATGEEAYSLAMVASEVADAAASPPYVGVVASDLCAGALATARAGEYPARRLQGVPAALRVKYFEAADGDRLRAVESLRRRLCCVRNNLLRPQQLPPLAMDVIFCQNVLVYFRRWRVKQIVDALAARLKPGGLLVLGPGEAAQWQHPAMVRSAHAGVSAWLSAEQQQGEADG